MLPVLAQMTARRIDGDVAAFGLLLFEMLLGYVCVCVLMYVCVLYYCRIRSSVVVCACYNLLPVNNFFFF